MMKFNPETFYKRHNKEIEKYIFDSKKTLHILSDDIDKNFIESKSNKLFINKNEKINQSLNLINDNFDLIIVTDLFENQENISEFFELIYSKLNDNGKVLITSVNNIWYPILNFFEFIGLKRNQGKESIQVQRR